MQKSKNVITNLVLLATLTASAQLLAGTKTTKVIYGTDNRVDVFESSNTLFKKLAKSTAAMIPSHKVEDLNAYEVKLAGNTLAERGMCKSERFADQPTTADCSGFLVGKDLLVTAGHCMKSDSDCASNKWVFDYKVEYSGQSEVVVQKTSVYECESILSQSLDSGSQNDYALIKLKKEVTGRSPLKYRTSGTAQVGDKLVVIGHPTGLPTKIADGASVRSIGSVFFTANLDTYGGNSGSAVFNAGTGMIEGILVRGDTDYIYDAAQGCQVSNVLANSRGRGEDVTLITNIKELEKPQDDSGTGTGTGTGGKPEPTVEPAPEPTVGLTPEPAPVQVLPAWLRWLLGL